MVDPPVRACRGKMLVTERSSATGLIPGCCAKCLSSNCNVAWINSGEMSRSAVCTRNFSSALNLTRRRLRLRSRTHCENEIPSSNGGLGSASQTKMAQQLIVTATRSVFLNHRLRSAVIPSEARNLAHPLFHTQLTKRALSRFERSLSAFGMTCVFTARSSKTHSVTTILPPTPRPFTPRSYIDCANTGGTMNSPRLHDLMS